MDSTILSFSVRLLSPPPLPQLGFLVPVFDGQSGVSPRLDQYAAPSLAMSKGVAEERDSQPVQRDELAHSRTVPTRGEVLSPTNVTPPIAITEDTESLQILLTSRFY